MENESIIQQTSVKEFIVNTLNECKVGRAENTKEDVYALLSAIVLKYGTFEYSFNLAMEFLIEIASENIQIHIEELLKTMDFRLCVEDEKENKIYFSEYYALSLIYKKTGELEKLKALIKNDNYSKALENQPLFFEVRARYFKRIGEFEEALAFDEEAINYLEYKEIENLAVCISYASTVCMMLDSGNKVPCDRLENAKKYIDRAIEYNPSYYKYYYLKALIVFYSSLPNRDLAVIEKKRKEAEELIDKKAKRCVYTTYDGRSRFSRQTMDKYSRFKNKMNDIIERIKNPKYPVSCEELDVLKEKILKEESQDSCATKSALPPLPCHVEGEKYFFTCYSSRDFKKVYSDLIELYKRKVPFRYDSTLRRGENWESQVERYIKDDSCVGVVFYISKNMLCTDSVSREIDITLRYNKKGFSVNLEGSNSPSKILKEIFKEKYNINPDAILATEELKKHLKFREFFDDNDVFVARFGDDNETSHIDALVDAISERFNDLVIGE